MREIEQGGACHRCMIQGVHEAGSPLSLRWRTGRQLNTFHACSRVKLWNLSGRCVCAIILKAIS
jgi:hypothetical protein